MSKEQISDRVRKVFEENGIIIPKGTESDELGLDSLTSISILVDIEQEIGIRFSETRLKKDLLSFADYLDMCINSIELDT